MCRTFLELHHEYPQSIDIMAVGEDQRSATIFYTVQNAFGATEMNNAYCVYGQDQRSKRVIMEQIQINGERLRGKRIERFSSTIPYIIYSKPDATLPPPLFSALDQLKDRKPFRIEIESAD